MPKDTKNKKVKVLHMIECLLVKQPYCRSDQVWHALSRDFTVLPAHPCIYPGMEGRDERLSWPRHNQEK